MGHVLSVVGARPQFVKLAPVSRALEHLGLRHRVLHTGQHYDPGMSDVFFDELAIPPADTNLGVGSGGHGAQTAAMLAGIEQVLLEDRPAVVLVYGDTNSTVAAALAAVKLHIPVAHLEAGLRSFNRRMPEEHNRVLTDHASDLLLAPSRVAVENLAAEGLARRTVHVGDVMVDVALQVRDGLRARPVELPPALGRDQPAVLATIHRAENTDDPHRLTAILDALGALPIPVVLAAHPRLVARTDELGVPLARGAIRPVPPLSYREMVAAVCAARAVVTDSGGLQKEAFVLGTPCATVRTETEWTETVELGWNVLVDDLSRLEELALREQPVAADDAPYGRGDAAEAVARVLADLVTEVP
jgi:UDP-N-acetylglucosamine 2-epimerase (non-hydrolysing)